MANRIEIKLGGVYTFSKSIKNNSLVVTGFKSNNAIDAIFFDFYDKNNRDSVIKRQITKLWFENNLPAYVCQIEDLFGRRDTSRFKMNLFKETYQLDTCVRYNDPCECCGTTDRSKARVKFNGHIICSECFDKYTSFCKHCGKRIYNTLIIWGNSSEFCDSCLNKIEKIANPDNLEWPIENSDRVVIPPKNINIATNISQRTKNPNAMSRVHMTSNGIPYFEDENGVRYYYLSIAHEKSKESDRPDKIRRSELEKGKSNKRESKYSIVKPEVYNDKDIARTFDHRWWNEELVMIFATLNVKTIAAQFNISSSEARIIKKNATMLITGKEVKPAEGMRYTTFFNQGYDIDEVINLFKDDKEAVIQSYRGWCRCNNSTSNTNYQALEYWKVPVTHMNIYDLATKFLGTTKLRFADEEKISPSIASDIIDKITTMQIYFEPLAIYFGAMAFRLNEIESYIASIEVKKNPTKKERFDLIVYRKVMKLRTAYVESFKYHTDISMGYKKIEASLINEDLKEDLMMLIRNRFGIAYKDLSESERQFIKMHSDEEVAEKFIWNANKVSNIRSNIKYAGSKIKEDSCTFDCHGFETMHGFLSNIGGDGLITIKNALQKQSSKKRKTSWLYEHILAPKSKIDLFYERYKLLNNIPKEFLDTFFNLDLVDVDFIFNNINNVDITLEFMNSHGFNLFKYPIFAKYVNKLMCMYA